MSRIDLHTHSSASDGTAAPDVLMRQARQAGLDVVALTDHDTTRGWDSAAQARPDELALVRGAEISCVADGISLHVLAYLFDPEEPHLAEALRTLRESRVARAEAMAHRLEQAGTGVTWQRVRQLAGGTVGRPHVAQALVEAGHVDSVGAAFTPEWIGTGGRFYVDKLELDPVEAVRLVVAAGGAPVVAHPAASKRGRTVEDGVLVAMAGAGLVGLEVRHPDHDEADRRRLLSLASELGLVVTGSSDYHGTNKPVDLGAETTDVAAYEQLVSRTSGVPVLQ